MHYVFVLRLRAENVAELVMQAAEMGGIGAESWRTTQLRLRVLLRVLTENDDDDNRRRRSWAT